MLSSAEMHRTYVNAGFVLQSQIPSTYTFYLSIHGNIYLVCEKEGVYIYVPLFKSEAVFFVKSDH